MRLLKSYGTHNPVLIKAIQNTQGTVVEFGSGIFSTPLLHWLCAGRKLITYEDDKEYYNFANQFRSRNHSVRLIDNWDSIPIYPWSVVLIDHKTERRKLDALRVKDSEIVILHDSETDTYKYSEVHPHFKYVYQWKFCEPWTAVVSNTIDFSLLWDTNSA